MSELDNFRPLPSIDLRRVFTSLGLPVTAFHNTSGKLGKILLDTVLNADASRPNGLWLFQGSNYFLYNLETGEIEDGPRPIASNFGGDTLPQLFDPASTPRLGVGQRFPILRISSRTKCMSA